MDKIVRCWTVKFNVPFGILKVYEIVGALASSAKIHGDCRMNLGSRSKIFVLKA
jgi:hypothetical protein